MYQYVLLVASQSIAVHRGGRASSTNPNQCDLRATADYATAVRPRCCSLVALL